LARELVDVFQEKREVRTMNLASEKVWKTKERVRGMRGGFEERKEGMLFKKVLYTVSAGLWTRDNWYSNHAATAFQCDRGRRKFVGQGLSPRKRCWISDSTS
jgi:hypothetical protein